MKSWGTAEFTIWLLTEGEIRLSKPHVHNDIHACVDMGCTAIWVASSLNGAGLVGITRQKLKGLSLIHSGVFIHR